MATKKPAGPPKVIIEGFESESEAETMSRLWVSPYLRHGVLAQSVSEKMMGKMLGDPQFDVFAKRARSQTAKATDGKLDLASELLMAQALSLDAMFTELARRASMNMGDYPQATERYARLAFKAQSNCRASLEAIAKLHQPREQTVRHVHVNEGGQAVVTDHFHNHTGGIKNEKTDGQSDATGAAGPSAALSGPDPLRDGVPIPSRERQAAMSDARRDEPRPAARKP